MRTIALLCLLSFAAALPAPQSSGELDEEYPPISEAEVISVEPDEGYEEEKEDGDKEYVPYPPEEPEPPQKPEDTDSSKEEEHNKPVDNSKEEDNENPVPVIIIVDSSRPSFWSNFVSHLPSFTSWRPQFSWPSSFSWPFSGGRYPKYAYHHRYYFR